MLQWPAASAFSPRCGTAGTWVLRNQGRSEKEVLWGTTHGICPWFSNHCFKVSTIIGLLYNCKIYTTEFTILTIFMCTVQWHWVHSHRCATITTFHLQNFFLSSQTKTLFPLNTVCPSSSPQPQANTPLLSVSMNLTTLVILHKNHRIFVLWWLAYFTWHNVVACDRISFLFKAE